MHDTDRTLAELAGLEGEEEAESYEMEPEVEGEDFESLADFEFTPEVDNEELESLDALSAELEDRSAFESGAPFDTESGFEAETSMAAESGYDSEAGFDSESAFDTESAFEAEADFEGESESDYEGEWEFGQSGEAAGDYETDETELAAELLEAQSEGELDHFLGGLVAKAAQKLGQALKSPTGQQVLALLKQAAKTALPALRTAAAGALGGPVGMALAGETAASGKLFGLELEGLAPEDQELETAKGFVRFALRTAEEAARLSPQLDPRLAARRAFLRAARRYAPGLLPTSASPAIGAQRYSSSHRSSGRWVRVGHNQVVLYGI